MSLIVPIDRQIQQLENSKENGTKYWENSMYLGQLVFKSAVAAILSSLEEDSEHTTYDYEYDLVRANSEGRWCEILQALETTEAFLHREIRDVEMHELTGYVRRDCWQYDAVETLRSAGKILGLDKNRDSFAHSPSRTSLIQWFRLFSEIRNGIRAHNSRLGTDDAKEREAAECMEKSARLVYENFSIFKRDWMYIRPDKSNGYYVRSLRECADESSLAKMSSLKNGSQAGLREGVYVAFGDCVRRVNMIFAFEEGNLFYFPNGGVNKSSFEIICYAKVEDNLKKVDIGAYSKPPKIKALSHTSGSEDTYDLGLAITNLPRLNELYVNRPKLEEELTRYISYEDRSPIIVLKGIGGIGKTSLALNAARTIAEKSRFSFIWWFSARDVDLLVDGVKEVRPDVVSYKDMAKLYCRLTGAENLDANEQIASFEKALSEHDKMLFIFDNFETVSGFKDVFEFILANVRCPNKVIITTRDERFYEYDRTVIDVMGMETNECEQLIKGYAEKYEIGDRINTDLIKQIIDHTSGHPYLIKLLLNDIVNNAKIGKINWNGKKERLLDQLCTRTFDSLSIDEKWVFLILCNIQGSIHRFILEGVLQNEDATANIRLDEVLVSLLRCSFIECVNAEEIDSSLNLALNSEEDFNLISVPSIVAEYGKNKLKWFSMSVEDGEEIIRTICKKIEGFGKMNVPGLLGAKHAVEKKLASLTKKGDLKGWDEISGEVCVLEDIARIDSNLQRSVARVYENFDCIDDAIRCYRGLIETISNPQENYRDWLSLESIFENGSIEKRVAWQRIAQSNCADKSDVCAVAEKIVTRIQNGGLRIDDSSCVKLVNLYANKLVEFERRGNFASRDYEQLCWLFIFLKKDVDEIKMYLEKGKKVSSLSTRFNEIEYALKECS